MIYFSDLADKLFECLPRVEKMGEDKLKIKCKLSQAGEVYLSRIPKIVTKSYRNY